MLGIVVNVARSRARAERRSVPLPAEPAGPVVDAARFRPSDAARWPDHWALGPVPWPAPEEDLLAGEAREVIVDAIGALPPAQREVPEESLSAEALDALLTTFRDWSRGGGSGITL